ncbi:MAG: hypothetical protein AAB516_01685 [Patescibacteria group bacterium]
MGTLISKKFIIIFLFCILLIGIVLINYTQNRESKETWKQYEDNVIAFQYPKDYSIQKMPNNFLQGTNNEGEEVIRITYLNIQDTTPTDIQGYKKTGYDDLKKAWSKTNINFFETQISDKNVLVSVYKTEDEKLKFSHIVQYGNYFWGLDYYEKPDQSSEYYVTNKIIPEIPQKIIDSAILKIQPMK